MEARTGIAANNGGSPPMLSARLLKGLELNMQTFAIFTLTLFLWVLRVIRPALTITDIYFYLTMAALSLTTVVLSLMHGCPTLPFYILEIIVNSAMIAEVGIRLAAFGKTFWKSYFNLLDVGITILCVLTVLVVFFSGCSAKSEEVFDDIILIFRNIIQFGRLAIVMRRSGKNIFTSGPQAIDLADATMYDLDLDYDDEDAQPVRPLRRDVESARASANSSPKPFSIGDET